MPISKEQIAEELQRRGYRIVHQTSKKQGWQLGTSRPLYVNLKSDTGVSALIVHPQVPARALAQPSRGSRCSEGYYHSSNLRLFPRRLHDGQNPIGYGWALTFESEVALREFLSHVEAVV